MTPDQFTLEERMLDVGDKHRLYVQLWGNKDAKDTILFLHGGPGSGCSDSHKTLFDPSTHKVIFFDQRGCGKSLPYGSLVSNTTDDLVEDINTIAAAFGVKTFAITGGSWGSLLALAYAVRYPKRVTRMVLRGIFTGRKSEIEFLDKGRFKAFFPDAWETFVASVPKKFQADPGSYHLPRAIGKDSKAAKRSAYQYTLLEVSVIGLDDRHRPEDYKTFDPAPTIIECHYMANNCFLPEGYIMDQAHRLTMPVQLVQGRYDMVCPPYTAYELAQKLPNGRLYWTTAGHSGNDRANWDLVKVLLTN
jgi:proline iminopeptidase